jgi:hypothetical protein
MAMLTKVARLLIAIGLLAGFTVGWASQLTGEQVITVCPQGPPACQFSRIQEATNVATDEAIILISPGLYIEREFLKISKNLSLVGSDPRSVRLLTSQVSIGWSAAVVNIQDLTILGDVSVFDRAQTTLSNVKVVGSIEVAPHGAEQPRTSRIILINVHVQESTFFALFVGPAAEAVVIGSELLGRLVASVGAKVWVSDTQIEIPTLSRYSRTGIEAYEGSDLALLRVKIFSVGHGVLARAAHLHIEESQLVATNGWGLALMIEACSLNLPSDATYEGLITGRNNEIIGARELGDVCPSELEFLKTPEGGQYP